MELPFLVVFTGYIHVCDPVLEDKFGTIMPFLIVAISCIAAHAR
jgi:hypothetical protein